MTDRRVILFVGTAHGMKQWCLENNINPAAPQKSNVILVLASSDRGVRGYSGPVEIIHHGSLNGRPYSRVEMDNIDLARHINYMHQKEST